MGYKGDYLQMHKGINKLLIILAWISIFMIIAAFNYFDVELTAFVPQCTFLTATGYECPGCGGTRSVQSLLRGDILRSVKCNFIPFVVGGYIISAFAEYSLSAFTRWNMKVFIFREWMLWGLGIAVIGFWVLRNIV